jgi:hypothetical protein
MRRLIVATLAASLMLVGVAPAATAAPNRAPAPGPDSIAEIAIDAGFTELVGALVYVDEELDTNLVELFSTRSGQYTVFAPTNEAFEDLYDFLGITEISDLPPELVLDVLLYHVTEGRRAANSVVPPRQPHDHHAARRDLLGRPDRDDHRPVRPGGRHRRPEHLGQQRHHPRRRHRAAAARLS